MALNEPLQVGQFAIVAHEPQERGAAIGIAEGNGTGADRCELFMLAEGTTPAASEFAGHLVSQAERTWKTLNLSLTGALIAIFAEAQRSLMDWNTRSVSQHRVGLGLGCLARQGDRIVLAARGPASILHSTPSAVTLHEPDDEHAEPMNGLERGQPQLISLTLAPGDRVLLVSANVTETLSEEELGFILRSSLPEILPNLYRRVSHLRDAAVLLVGVPEGGEEALAPPLPPAADEPRSREPAASDAGGPVIGGQAPPPAGGGDPDFQPSLFVQASPAADALELARRRMAAAEPRSRAADLPDVTPLARPRELPPLRRAVGDGGVPPRFGAGGAIGGPSFFRQVAHVRTPPPPSLASHQTGAAPVGQLAADRRMQLAAGTGAPATATGRMTPQGQGSGGGSVVRVRASMGAGMGGMRRTGGRGAATGGGFTPPTWLVVLVGTVLLAAIVGWVALPGLFQSDEAARLSGLIDEAEREIATASAVDRADLRREALTRARGILLEAMALEGGVAPAEPLLRQAERELAALDAIVAPADIRAIADLRGFGEAPIAPRSLAVGGGHAYVLDSAGAQVVSVSLSTGKKTSVFAASEQTPLAPAAITWSDIDRPDGSALLIADAGGALWAWSPAGWLAQVEFARPDGLAITDMHYSEGALYVLDAPAATVYRFASSGTGFALEPAVMLQGAELASARRLMVDGGDVFTAGEDGTVRRFSGELTLALAQAGIDRPLTAPATPHILPGANEIALLDASADRIVVLGRDGAFARQYRHEDLENLTAFTVRDGFGYVISGEQLRRVTFQR